MADIFGYLSGFGTSLYNSIYYFLVSVPILLILTWIIVTARNKKKYNFKVRIYRVREGGRHKEANFKGGYVNRKNSAPFFRIKTGFFKSIDLTTTPNPRYIDEEDRVYYKQIDVNTYVQMKRRIERGEIIITPVESDVKYGAILSIQRIKDVLRTEPAWKKLLPFGGLIILAIVFIISYAMLMKSCS